MNSNDRVDHFPHVCVIESPNPNDILDGRNEGEALSRALALGGVRNHYYFVTTAVTLQRCLLKMATDTAITFKEGIPQFPMLYVHFSMHGNADGIALTNGDFVSWSELGDALINFAACTERIFPEVPACMQTLSFSVCEGLHGAKMTAGKQVCPFYGMIGSLHRVSWTDSLTAFITFYHNVCHKRVRIIDGVDRMNAAIGEPNMFRPLTCSQFGYEDSLSE